MRYIRRVPAHADDRSERHSPAANARRTAALVNALTCEAAEIPELAAILRDFGEVEPITLTQEDLLAMRDAAGQLREVFAADDVEAAALSLNRLLAAHTGPLRLTTHHGTAPIHPHLDGSDDAPWPEWFLATSCMALAVLLWQRQCSPGGVCASSSCRRVFIAQGTGVVQRYCSRRCATRERVAAHRRKPG
ncbi:hypothetical protein ABH931_007344 [Streptacidiphilus sp. MAP12-33]|uniref:CGNR zinc finger domain-containing protein n=1 Tax=Streptacidiphilus sp. MAP12-33 TaxID=3156266 RepID=UPI003515DBA8